MQGQWRPGPDLLAPPTAVVAGSGDPTCARNASPKFAPFTLGPPTPHAGVLTRLQRPAQTGVDDRALPAHRFRSSTRASAGAASPTGRTAPDPHAGKAAW